MRRFSKRREGKNFYTNICVLLYIYKIYKKILINKKKLINTHTVVVRFILICTNENIENFRFAYYIFIQEK